MAAQTIFIRLKEEPNERVGAGKTFRSRSWQQI